MISTSTTSLSLISNLSQSKMASLNACVDINDYMAVRAFDWTSVTSVRVLVVLVYCLLFITGILGNAGVILKVARNKKLQSARNIFLVNLMASDFLLCLTAVPFTPVSVIMKRWVFGGVICKLIPLCQSMSVIITSLSLTAIAVDKYVHIMDSTKPPVTIGQATGAVVIIWAVACLLNLPLVLSYDVFDGAMYYEEYGEFFCGEFCDEVHWSAPEHKKIYGTTVMCIQFVIPMTIIIFCYTCIMRKVQADMIIDNKQFSQSMTAIQRMASIKKKRKVNYILIMMVVAFVGAWLPLTTFNILRDYSLLPSFVSQQPFLWALIVHSTAMTTVLWNPLLFFWLTSRSRRHRGHQWNPSNASASLTFSLASSPFQYLIKRRRKRTDASSFTEEYSAYEGLNQEHEISSGMGITIGHSSCNLAGSVRRKGTRCSNGELKIIRSNNLEVPVITRVSPPRHMSMTQSYDRTRDNSKLVDGSIPTSKSHAHLTAV